MDFPLNVSKKPVYLYKNCTMRGSFHIILLCMLLAQAKGQQVYQFSQYFFNKYEANPAYGGLERSLSAFVAYRDQYSAFPGNPRSLQATIDLPLYAWNGAAGMSIQNTTTGLFRESTVKVSYNQVFGTPVGFFSAGGRVGLQFLQIDGSAITTPEGEYEGGINHNDPQLNTIVYLGVNPIWEAGVFFYNQSIEAGVNVAHIPTHSSKLGQGTFTRTSFASLFAQYKYRVSEQLTLMPSTFLKLDRAVWQLDLAVIAQWEENIITGLGWRGLGNRAADAAIFYIGTNIGKKYRLLYSYDLGVSSLASQHQGSHEITIHYNLQKLFGMGLPPKIIYNPRDL